METHKKRALTKVRRDFLFKKADENEEEKEIDPSTRCLSNNQVNIIAGDLGMVERNREICLEFYYANQQYQVDRFELEQRSHSLVINLELKSHKFNVCPVEYTIKRLESYGNLELATWAHRIKKSQTSHSQSMTRYYDALKLSGSNGLATLIEAKERADLLCKDLESRYSFFKVRYFADQDSKHLSSISFDGGFLKRIGHNIHDFGSSAVRNGLPIITDETSIGNMKYGQAMLDCNLVDYESVFEGPEQTSKLVDKNGFKKNVQMRTVFILEPSPEGVYMNTYYILLDQPLTPGAEKLAIPQDNLATGLKSYKPFIEEIREKLLANNSEDHITGSLIDSMQEES
jgi:hypothetical protein